RDSASGTIEVDETRVASRYGGRVEQIFAGEGDSLKPGQLLVRLDAAELKARFAQSAAALEELKAGARKEEVKSAKDDWQSVVAPNQNVATLLFSNHLWVRVYVPEPWLGYIKLGEKVRVKVDSFPNKDFTGVVEQIARAAEFTPRNVQTVSERIKQVFGIKVRL